MDLKNIILETLKEFEDEDSASEPAKTWSVPSVFHDASEEIPEPEIAPQKSLDPKPAQKNHEISQNTHVTTLDREFLHQLREKLLVLFHGLREKKDERRVNLVVNFLEYELALIDDFLENSERED